MKKILVLILVLAMFALNAAPFAQAAYIVQSGDVLWRIAQNNGTTWQELADYNELENPNLIYTGQILEIPGDVTPEPTPEPTVSVEEFEVEYEMFGTTSAGVAKNDTFLWSGVTEDGIITELEFDVWRNMGTADGYSKKDIYGYEMNISDVEIVETEDGTLDLVNITVYSGGLPGLSQYGYGASCEDITVDTKFGDLTFFNDFSGAAVEDEEKVLLAYSLLAAEVGVDELTMETPLVEFLDDYGVYANGEITTGENRISFDGARGGRSYGEQLDAVVDYILAEGMTQEEVYEFFKGGNPVGTPDAVAGVTISFVGDWQRMVYIAIHGELFNGVLSTSERDEGTRYEVVTQGYAGEIETYVTIDANGDVVSIEVRDANETAGIGAVLTEDDSAFIQALVAGADDVTAVDGVAGATVTSNALKEAVVYAQEAFAADPLEAVEVSVEEFEVEYEMFGTTSAGVAKNDTFLWSGVTEDGIITELEFDVWRNMGTADGYSKKDIYGYEMNISDVEIVETEDGTLDLVNITVYSGGLPGLSQYGYGASCEDITVDTKFGDLTFFNDFSGAAVEDEEKVLLAYSLLAAEVGVDELTMETPLVEFLDDYGVYANGEITTGENRISFDGARGGRSYGEQLDAVVDYILAEGMTQEEVYEFFKGGNPVGTPDAVAGVTISFVGDWQRMVYIAIHGELFNGVLSTSERDEGTRYEVVTQGYAGEIETYVTIDANGDVVSIEVRDANETAGIGAVLTEDDSAFIQALIAGADDVTAVDGVAGATVTSNALKEAVVYAQEAFAE